MLTKEPPTRPHGYLPWLQGLLAIALVGTWAPLLATNHPPCPAGSMAGAAAAPAASAYMAAYDNEEDRELEREGWTLLPAANSPDFHQLLRDYLAPNLAAGPCSYFNGSRSEESFKLIRCSENRESKTAILLLGESNRIKVINLPVDTEFSLPQGSSVIFIPFVDPNRPKSSSFFSVTSNIEGERSLVVQHDLDAAGETISYSSHYRWYPSRNALSPLRGSLIHGY